MSATTQSIDHVESDVLQPLVAAVAGAIVFAVAMTAGEVFDLNSDGADAPSDDPDRRALVRRVSSSPLSSWPSGSARVPGPGHPTGWLATPSASPSAPP